MLSVPESICIQLDRPRLTPSVFPIRLQRVPAPRQREESGGDAGGRAGRATHEGGRRGRGRLLHARNGELLRADGTLWN